MDKIKKYIKPIYTWAIFMLAYILLLTLLSYFQIFKTTTIVKINFIVIAIFIFILGINFGKKSSKHGYIEGIKLGLIIDAILFLLNLIFIRCFSLNIFIYYLIIIASSTFGSMLGINLKK